MLRGVGEPTTSSEARGYGTLDGATTSSEARNLRSHGDNHLERSENLRDLGDLPFRAKREANWALVNLPLRVKREAKRSW